jgi:hypothetical protein
MPSWKPLAATLAAMAASIEDLRSQVQALSARLDTLAAIRQPMAATPPRSRQPTAARPAATQTPPYDPTKYTLGRLCPRGHDYQGTGQSLRRRHNGECAQCILVHRCDGPLVWTEHRGRAESFHSRLRHWHVCITLEETRRVVTAVPPAERERQVLWLSHRNGIHHAAGRAWSRWSDAISSISAWNDGHSGNPPAAVKLTDHPSCARNCSTCCANCPKSSR